MKNIALAILSVGLCFYQVYRVKNGMDIDWIASLVSFIAAIEVFFNQVN
jgi:hypothetical protein